MKSKTLCQRFRVEAYPSLQLVKNNKLYIYNGDRGLENILGFMNGGYRDSPGYEIYQSLPSTGEVFFKDLSYKMDQIKAAYTINSTGLILFLIVSALFVFFTLSTLYTLFCTCFILPAWKNFRANIREMNAAEAKRN